MWGVQRGKSSEEIDDDGNTVAKKIHVVKKNMKQIWKHDETWINMGFTLFKICMYQLFTSANEMSKMPSALSVYMTCVIICETFQYYLGVGHLPGQHLSLQVKSHLITPLLSWHAAMVTGTQFKYWARNMMWVVTVQKATAQGQSNPFPLWLTPPNNKTRVNL